MLRYSDDKNAAAAASKELHFTALIIEEYVKDVQMSHELQKSSYKPCLCVCVRLSLECK